MKTRKILIVDDNVKNIQLAANVIKNKTNYSIIYATRAKEAFKLLENHEISLILLDVMMPEMDGYEAAKIISSNPRTDDIPIIFLTANADEESLNNAFESGGQDYISKPFNPHELLNRVRIHVELYHSKKNLQDANTELETIFHTNKDGIAILDLDTNFLTFNKAYLDMTGFSHEELLTKSCISLSAPEDMQRSRDIIDVVIRNDYVENYNKTCVVKNGKRIQVSMSLAMMPDKERILISTRDVTKVKATQKKMLNYIELIDRYIITSSTDVNGTITNVSEAFCEINGYQKESFIGNRHTILRCRDYTDDFYKQLWNTIEQDKIWIGEIKNQKRDGSFYWLDTIISPSYNDNGEKIGYNAISHDITDKKRIEELSITDTLTGIYNRLKLDELCDYEIQQSYRYKTPMSLLIIDIDHFKNINDTYGHQVGDKVLQEVTQLISKNIRATDSLGRWGGEEFLMLLPKTDYDYALNFAQKIRKLIDDSVFNSVEHLTISIGVTEFQTGDNEKTLLERADKALYEAKNSGRNKVVGKV